MKYDVKMDGDEESALVRQAMGGNLDAFNQLVLQYQDIAYHHAYAFLGDTSSAEDITQESFIKAFKHIHGIRGAFFRTWLLKIVTNCAYDFLRRKRRHTVHSLFLMDNQGEEYELDRWLVSPSGTVEEMAIQAEESKHIYQMLDELPGKYRSAITLIDVYELSYVEAAEILKVPVGTLKSRLARARKLMRRKLQDVSFTNQYPAYRKVGFTGQVKNRKPTAIKP